MAPRKKVRKVIETPYPFPVSSFQDVFKVTSIPATQGTNLKHTVITETAYPNGNNTKKVETYSVTIYDAAGRLYAYNSKASSFDQYI